MGKVFLVCCRIIFVIFHIGSHSGKCSILFYLAPSPLQPIWTISTELYVMCMWQMWYWIWSTRNHKFHVPKPTQRQMASNFIIWYLLNNWLFLLCYLNDNIREHSFISYTHISKRQTYRIPFQRQQYEEGKKSTNSIHCIVISWLNGLNNIRSVVMKKKEQRQRRRKRDRERERRRGTKRNDKDGKRISEEKNRRK